MSAINELAINEFESANVLAIFFNNVFVNEPIKNLPHSTHSQVPDSLSVIEFPKEARLPRFWKSL